MPRTLPKPPVSLPSTLNGYTNGSLPASILKPTTFGNALAEPTAARAFRAFAAVEVRPRGIDPRHVGGYRDLYGQWDIFGGNRRRYQPCTLAEWQATPAAHRKTWAAADRALVELELRAAGHNVTIPVAYYWRKIRNANGSWPASAARPRTSNHGLGLALDIGEENDGDAAVDPITDEFVDLLIDRGHLYGIGAEMDSERWHWRYYAGDAIPAAVLAYEASIAGPAIDYPLPTIRLGSTGTNVATFQRHNNEWHAAGACPTILKVDGIAGPATVAGIKRFQVALNVPADGVWGTITATKYRAVLLDVRRAGAAA